MGATGVSNCSQLSWELGLWPGADSFLRASVCMGGMCTAMSMSDRTLDMLLDHLSDIQPFFYNPAPLLEPVKMVNGTGYRNWISLVLLP